MARWGTRFSDLGFSILDFGLKRRRTLGGGNVLILDLALKEDGNLRGGNDGIVGFGL
jgi:hypothetical protein